ncbi:TIM-barrel protein, yjbN family [Methylocella silvestris BL2]|uniref:tRNA-dihydrouridine(20/20a) synthase n=1 Tax=Methylocella silvestris (strain DSM 15510 / CIP 108128 / LMG 27833 / NCIMB 13906 / BL2) TaxID=395965 RepID=B8ETC6_METSB|nr:tRNA dihydrouridine(20/20a) synthase DusA [Methylocella silvestris]ACK51768.1 TIM-barrel protein, yjbN family [Methylocella silvestris BL2]
MKQYQAYRFSVAPMMDWTDRHCRSFHRLLTRRARLYTEMVTTGAVLHGQRDRLLGFDAAEHPLAAQLGGSDPADLAAAARICADFGYDEINLNAGCPSKRVQNGAFGACLMREPELVGDCVAAMKAAVSAPVTVKCRIGVDEQEPREALFAFAETVLGAGADALIVHARKAWLEGLSPKDNRHIPPLDYALVHELKRRFPDTPIAINGGLDTIDAMRAQLDHVDGVMIGRAAYQDPALLLEVDPVFFGEDAPFSEMAQAIEAFTPYIAARLTEGVPLNAMVRHLLGAFNGRPGARAFRRHLATESVKPGAGLEVLRAALALIGSRAGEDQAEAAE